MADTLMQKKMKRHLESAMKKMHLIGGVKGVDVSAVIKAIDMQPAANVVPVVRCKDCTEWNEKEQECSHWYGFRENDFCSYGRKKDEISKATDS